MVHVRRAAGTAPTAGLKLFGDEVQAVAILDRLLHDAEILTVNGPSCRLRGRGDLLAGDDKTAENSESGEPDTSRRPPRAAERLAGRRLVARPAKRRHSIFTAGGATIHCVRRPWDRHPPWAH